MWRLEDTPPPVNDGGKVKADLYTRNNVNLIEFARTHEQAMAGNTNYPTPTPAAAVFGGKVDALADALAAYNAAKKQARETKLEMDEARKALLQDFQMRVAYVQMASNGNSAVISSSGLELRHHNSPVGSLPWPENLRVQLNGAAGMMELRWKSVRKASSYLLEYAEEGEGERVWQNIATGKTTLKLTDMPIGRTFVFRVAAVGGTDGRSVWSPEVRRASS